MYHNGQCYIWIPTALTLSRLTAESAALINSVHGSINQATGSKLKTNCAAGETHEYYLALNDLAMGGAPFTRDAVPGLAVCGPISNLSYLPLSYVALICAFGGDVEALPVWFELTSLSDEVPESFPDRTYVDTAEGAEGSELVHTWETWGVAGDSHKPVQYGDKWYRSSCVGQSGQMLDSSQYVNAGLTILTRDEYLGVVASHTPALA